MPVKTIATLCSFAASMTSWSRIEPPGWITAVAPAAIIDRIGGPQARQARQMISGKNENQLRDIAMNMAKQRGVDLNALAQQMGVQIPK
jgi:hypothetical protein